MNDKPDEAKGNKELSVKKLQTDAESNTNSLTELIVQYLKRGAWLIAGAIIVVATVRTGVEITLTLR
ncbi:hypothetical protein AB0L53_58900 [Nonomuraea sp. NPDC052129]|uniref:hypothetical protein n=1 Tax=Nonomuraea sp. NPDC052129 TaxID=3154651 RepID=UPI003445B8EF